jgi:hypothetical protein
MSATAQKFYLGDSKIGSAERDYLLNSGSVALTTPEEIQDLARRVAETHAHFLEWIHPRMTRQRAERIRELRCVQDQSYRSIAGQLALERSADGAWNPPTNSIAGVVLCECAAELLGEDVHAYPWEAREQ